ncbi:MAG: hypothetical protein QXP81_11030 [Nitrososphaerota archaeon]
MEDFNDPLSLEELTEKVLELTERVTKLEALLELHEKTFQEIKGELRRLEAKLEARIDRYFWLWVTTLIAAVVLRVFGYL